MILKPTLERQYGRGVYMLLMVSVRHVVLLEYLMEPNAQDQDLLMEFLQPLLLLLLLLDIKHGQTQLVTLHQSKWI